MNDQDLRKNLVGKWTCENKWFPHNVEFRSDGTMTIVMSSSNVLGGLLGMFSGTKCEGTWAIHENLLRISFDSVPDSWLNQDFKIGGFGFRIPIGDLYTKYNSIVMSAAQFSKLEIKKLTSTEMIADPYRGTADFPFHWTRQIP